MSWTAFFRNLKALSVRPFAKGTGTGPSRRRRLTPRKLLVEQLEDRTVPSTLGQIGGAGTESLSTQTMDSSGNTYLAGYFNQAADFDPGIGTTPQMVPQGAGDDEFVAKYTPAGALAWAKRFGGSLGDPSMNGLIVDALGNTYVSGQFTGTADFGNNITLTASSSGGNAYVMKLDPSGTTAWVRSVGGATSSLGARGVAVDGTSVYCTGSFGGQVDFDPLRSYPDKHDILMSTGTGKTPPNDAFVWRLAADGSFVSAWGIGGTSNDVGQSILAANGAIYLHGSFQGTADFDPSPTVTVNRTSVKALSGSAYVASLFVARYTPNAVGGLTLNWVQTIGGSNYMTPSWKLTADVNHLYLPGGFAGTVDFDRNNGVSDARDTLNSVAGSGDAFVAEYNLADGSLAWVRGIGGPGGDEAGSSVAVTDTGMVYIGGVFSQTVDFDPAHSYTDNRDVLTSKGSVDGFNLQLDMNGAFVNAWRMGGAGYDTSRVIGVYGGRLYAAGAFEQTADFPTGGTLTSFGARDLFLQALDFPRPQIGSFTASPNPVTVGNPVTLTASNITDANPGSTITQVAFYLDSNGDGKLDPATDTLLGYGTQTSTGTWTFTFTFTFSTAGIYKLFAQAKDSYGVLSDPLALDLQVL